MRVSVGVALFLIIAGYGRAAAQQREEGSGRTTALPAPVERGTMTLEEALRLRHSVRAFTAETLTIHEVAQLLWAAQGITHGDGYRTAPSAGALYPLELYLVTGTAYARYEPVGHRLATLRQGDLRRALARAAGGQSAVGTAPAVFVIAGVRERTAAKYGTRAERYVVLEAGHAAENLLLEATALGLGGVPVGAFDDASVRRVLDLPAGRTPLYLLPVGHPRE